MNSQPCTDTLDLLNSELPEPQATAAAASDLPEQAKAYARKLANKATKQGYQPTHLHLYTDAHGQPLYWKTRAKHLTFDSLTPEQQATTAKAAGANGDKWIRAFHHDGASFVAKEPAFTGGKPLYKWHELLNTDAGQAVYICEGEQKADYLCSLGLIATTSGGKSSANATDWQPLAGRKVIVWPDFDDAGQSYQADVTSVLSGLDCDLWALDVAQLDLPPKGDVINWQKQRTASGLTTTAADVTGLPVVKIEPIQAEPTANEKPKPKTRYPQGIPAGHLAEPMAFGGGFFEVKTNGLHFVEEKDGSEQAVFVSSPIIIRAMTRSGTSQAWGRLLEWRDPDNRLHQWAMPLELLQGDGADVRRELASRGMQIYPSRRSRELFTSYLQSYPTEQRALCVNKLGWHGGVYVMPDRASGQSDQLTVFQNPHGLEPAFSQLGTLQQWRDHVAVLAVNNSRLGLALSMAFAAVLADLVGEQGGGIHIKGGSSTGKSTALKMACSVWGDPEQYGREWRTTDNALEGLAALHNDGLLVLDELNQCDPRVIGTAVYMLANGQGKARMHKTGTTKDAIKWRVLFLSAGEESLSALMQQAGKRTNAGQEIRLAEIPADAGQSMGMFEHIHTASSPQAFSEQAKAATKRYYGTAGQAFLEHVTKDPQHAAEQTRQHMQAFMAHVPSQATGQAHRVASRFALIAAGGEIATDAGITGWSKGEATESARQCFDAWLESFGMIGNHEERAILAHVKAFFEANGSSRFESYHPVYNANDEPIIQKVINRAGYFKEESGSKRYLVFPEQFRTEICKGYDHKQVSKVLIQHGWIDHNNDSGATKPERLPDSGKLTRMYSFNDRMWGESVIELEENARNNRNSRNNQQQQGQNLLREAEMQTVTTVTNTVTSQSREQTPPPVTVVTVSQNSNRNNASPSISSPVTVVTAVTAKKQDDLPVTATATPPQWSADL
ncbi:MAG: DUF927 domain-containing protein [Moraxellaceae bacterium]